MSSCHIVRVWVCVYTYSDSECRAPYLCAVKPSWRGGLALAAKGAREKLHGIIGTALRSLAHAKYALQTLAATHTRVTYLLCVSKRVARFLRAGECRWVMRRTLSAVSESRECTRGTSFSPRSLRSRLAARRLPGMDLPQGMDGVVRDAILEPRRVGTRTVTWKVT